MKKINLLLLFTISFVFYSVAQNTFPSAGNVGIGTGSPNFTLEVNGNQHVNGQSWFSYGSNMGGYSWMNAALTTNSIEIVNNNGQVSTSSPTLGFHRYGSGGPQFRLAADGSNILYLESAGPSSARNPNPYGGGANSYFARLHIDGALTTAGKIGIGTTSPSANLDIFGNSPTAGNLVLSANYIDKYRWRFNTIDRGAAIDMDITASDFNDVQQTILKLSPTYSGRPSFVLQDNWLVGRDGNIGIGTSDTHGYKLAVNGNIHTQEVKVDLQNWPDYVFNPTYNLPSLIEVKKYIDQNQHLPDMPSEAEVAKDGIGLGEMNKLLVEKVEQLTLYLIQQQKLNETQKYENLKQRKHITAMQKQLNTITNLITKK